MTAAEELSQLPPRPSDSALLRRSLKRPTQAALMFSSFTVMWLLNAWVGFGSAGSIAWGVASSAMAVLLGVWSRRAMRRRDALWPVWRDGIAAEVTVDKVSWIWTYAYRSKVSIDGREATVFLARDSEIGSKRRALIHGDWIGVVDDGGYLKIGRLR